MKESATLPADRRRKQGGALFLGSLTIFFLATLLLYLLYAYWRRDDGEGGPALPMSFAASTTLLVFISGLAHWSTLAVRRDAFRLLLYLLLATLGCALLFVAVQMYSLSAMVQTEMGFTAAHRGTAGMVIVMAILHALHVMGGIIAITVVTLHAVRGRYDHESHWAVDFNAHYWHFLDIVWLCMLATFLIAGRML